MQKERTRILILVKTYPTLSKKYSELVCTAGIREDGSWIRIYPIPYRFLEIEQKYKKYQWIEADILRNHSDKRPESYKLVNSNNIKLLETIDTKNQWQQRKEIILGKVKIFENIKEIIHLANEKNELSLALFKPTRIKDFIIEEEERDWPKDRIEKIMNNFNQQDLFTNEEQIKTKKYFQLAKKLPYKFSYKFSDDTEQECTLMIEDWEIGQLYWNCLKKAEGDEREAKEKVKEKYFDYFLSRDLYFYLGTTREYHGWAKNPFIIIGAFYPPQSKSNSPIIETGQLF
jgi:hypothetical protein